MFTLGVYGQIARAGPHGSDRGTRPDAEMQCIFIEDDIVAEIQRRSKGGWQLREKHEVIIVAYGYYFGHGYAASALIESELTRHFLFDIALAYACQQLVPGNLWPIAQYTP